MEQMMLANWSNGVALTQGAESDVTMAEWMDMASFEVSRYAESCPSCGAEDALYKFVLGELKDVRFSTELVELIDDVRKWAVLKARTNAALCGYINRSMKRVIDTLYEQQAERLKQAANMGVCK
jgi:hypothetical protein